MTAGLFAQPALPPDAQKLLDRARAANPQGYQFAAIGDLALASPRRDRLEGGSVCDPNKQP